MAGNDFYSLYTGHDFNQDIQNAQIQPMQFELQKMGLQEQLQEAKQQAQPQGGQPQGGLAGMAGGAPTQQSALAQGAKSIFGNADVKLTDANGNQTMAGKINDEYQQAAKDNLIAQGLDNDSLKMKRMATFETDPSKRAEMMNKASEVALRAQQIREKNQKLQDDYKKEWQDVQAQGLLNMANAKTQREVDQARKDYEDKTGTPVPAFIPDKLDPNGMRKALDNPNIPKAVGDAVRKDLRDQQTAQDLHAERQRRLQKEQAADQGNGPISQAGKTIDLDNSQQVQNFTNMINKKAKTVKDVATNGEVKTVLSQISPEYRADLNSSSAIKDVNAKLDTARQAYKISDFVSSNKITTGKFGELYKSLDAYDSSPASTDSINKVVNNQELSKMILDYANAYSRSATGRGVATIAELKAALKTFSEGSMSGTSSAKVFNFMGNKTEQEIADKYFGGDKDAVKLKHTKMESQDGKSEEGKAPAEAISHLKEHPELKEAFKKKYGYLPEGM